MHATDIDMTFKGASKKKALTNDVEKIEWMYMMALDNAPNFRMFCSDAINDGMTLRDDGIALSVDPELLERLNRGHRIKN